jgi:hypothetical protein
MWTYDQSSGQFSQDGKLLFTGYSGLWNGKNNPSMQAAKGIGPIPAGLWHIGGSYDSHKTGPATILLVPDEKTETFGRSEFRIHGDSISAPGTASHGCIILPRFIRNKIIGSTDKLLTVVE